MSSTLEAFEEVKLAVANLRDDEDVDKHLPRIRALIEAVDQQLDGVQLRLVTLTKLMKEVNAGLVEMELTVQSWIFTATLILTALLLWMGAAQFCLLLQGRRLFRAPEGTEEACETA